MPAPASASLSSAVSSSRAAPGPRDAEAAPSAGRPVREAGPPGQGALAGPRSRQPRPCSGALRVRRDGGSALRESLTGYRGDSTGPASVGGEPGVPQPGARKP